MRKSYAEMSFDEAKKAVFDICQSTVSAGEIGERIKKELKYSGEISIGTSPFESIASIRMEGPNKEPMNISLKSNEHGWQPEESLS